MIEYIMENLAIYNTKSQINFSAYKVAFLSVLSEPILSGIPALYALYI